MITRLSLISLLLVTNSLLSMNPEHIAISMNDLGITGDNFYITSLQSWTDFAKTHESVDEHMICPKAIAEFQQKYEIKTNLAVLPELIQAWANMRDSDGYKTEVLRIHASLRDDQNDLRLHPQLADLKDVFIKHAYEQLEQTNQKLITQQNRSVMMRRWAVGLTATIAVLFVVYIVELFLKPQKSHY